MGRDRGKDALCKKRILTLNSCNTVDSLIIRLSRKRSKCHSAEIISGVTFNCITVSNVAYFAATVTSTLQQARY